MAKKNNTKREILSTERGLSSFSGKVTNYVDRFNVAKVNDDYVAYDLEGKRLGVIEATTVTGCRKVKHKDHGRVFKLSGLAPKIDPSKLVSRDPSELSKEQLVALTVYLKNEIKEEEDFDKIWGSDDDEDDCEEDDEEEEDYEVERKPKPRPVKQKKTQYIRR